MPSRTAEFHPASSIEGMSASSSLMSFQTCLLPLICDVKCAVFEVAMLSAGGLLLNCFQRLWRLYAPKKKVEVLNTNDAHLHGGYTHFHNNVENVSSRNSLWFLTTG